MKKFFFTLAVVIFSLSSYAQSNSQLDSLYKTKRDSIYLNKSGFIGQPLSKLLSTFSYSLEFSSPDYLGGKRFGTSFYKDFLLFFPDIPNRGVIYLNITIANKYVVSVPEYLRLRGTPWNEKMRIELSTQIVTDIKKY